MNSIRVTCRCGTTRIIVADAVPLPCVRCGDVVEVTTVGRSPTGGVTLSARILTPTVPIAVGGAHE